MPTLDPREKVPTPAEWRPWTGGPGCLAIPRDKKGEDRGSENPSSSTKRDFLMRDRRCGRPEMRPPPSESGPHLTTEDPTLLLIESGGGTGPMKPGNHPARTPGHTRSEPLEARRESESAVPRRIWCQFLRNVPSAMDGGRGSVLRAVVPRDKKRAFRRRFEIPLLIQKRDFFMVIGFHGHRIFVVFFRPRRKEGSVDGEHGP